MVFVQATACGLLSQLKATSIYANHVCRSQWPRGLRRGSAAALAGIAGSNPVEGMDMSTVSFVCCQVEVSATG